jgi:diphthamide biosynthesis methyltransferase
MVGIKILDNAANTIHIVAVFQESFYGVPVTLADRNMVESEAEQIYERALNEDVAFLVVGDPLWWVQVIDVLNIIEY